VTMYTPIQGIEKAYFHQHKTDHPPVDLTFSDDGNKLFVGFYQDGGSVETFHLNVSLATWVRTERIHGDNIGRAVAVSSEGPGSGGIRCELYTVIIYFSKTTHAQV
jgi:hypothetical protein